jgi:hypothetical protein
MKVKTSFPSLGSLLSLPSPPTSDHYRREQERQEIDRHDDLPELHLTPQDADRGSRTFPKVALPNSTDGWTRMDRDRNDLSCSSDRQEKLYRDGQIDAVCPCDRSLGSAESSQPWNRPEWLCNCSTTASGFHPPAKDSLGSSCGSLGPLG